MDLNEIAGHFVYKNMGWQNVVILRLCHRNFTGLHRDQMEVFQFLDNQFAQYFIGWFCAL